MNYQKIFLILFLFFAVIILLTPPAQTKPILIQLDLEKESDYEMAISLGAVAYHRFDGSFLVEIESEKLKKLDEFGLKYQIVDENPWTKDYFLVFSSDEFLLKVNLELYGVILLKNEKWQLVKISLENAQELVKNRFNVAPILHKPIPLKYKPSLKLNEPALRYYPSIDSLTKLVSKDSIRTWVKRLQEYYSRCTFSDSIPFARQWIYGKFKSFEIS